MAEFTGLALLRGDSRGDLRHPARRAVDRPADAHGAAGHRLCREPARTATRSTCCCCRASVSECYEMAQDAFDLAERFQTPVFVMSDLDLGMNTWMSDPFAYPDKPLDRGKVLDAETLKRLGDWGRYKDVDGDGIPYRSLPGTGMPAYFTRGSGHNEKAQYSERPDDLRAATSIGWRASSTPRATLVPEPIVDAAPDARVGIIAYGTSHWAIVESRDQLRARSRPRDLVPAPARLSVLDGARRLHRRATTASTSSSRTATRRCSACCGMELSRRADRQAAQRAALQRPADRRAIGDRGHPRAGRRSLVTHRRRRGASAAMTERRHAVGGRRRHAAVVRQTAMDTHDRSAEEDQPHRPRARRPIAAARRRSAPAAGTTPSPSASSTRSTRWASTRSR